MFRAASLTRLRARLPLEPLAPPYAIAVDAYVRRGDDDAFPRVVDRDDRAHYLEGVMLGLVEAHVLPADYFGDVIRNMADRHWARGRESPRTQIIVRSLSEEYNW